ncbi:MAG: hypothetical protein WC770_04485 [Phycisphaerae bacterium]|jgi:hypothetical protein
MKKWQKNQLAVLDCAQDARDICEYLQAMLFRMMERFHVPLAKGTATYSVTFDKLVEAICGSLKK